MGNLSDLIFFRTCHSAWEPWICAELSIPTLFWILSGWLKIMPWDINMYVSLELYLEPRRKLFYMILGTKCSSKFYQMISPIQYFKFIRLTLMPLLWPISKDILTMPNILKQQQQNPMYSMKYKDLTMIKSYTYRLGYWSFKSILSIQNAATFHLFLSTRGFH